MSKSVLLGLILSGWMLSAGAALAADPVAGSADSVVAPEPAAVAAPIVGNATVGKQKAFMCKGCHNNQGYKTAYPKVYEVPRLGGQHAEYIVSALGQYRSGERSFATMRAMAANLSDQDIADLAAYYSSAN